MTHPASHRREIHQDKRQRLQRRARRAYLHPRNVATSQRPWKKCLDPATDCIYRHLSRIVKAQLFPSSPSSVDETTPPTASTSFDIVVMGPAFPSRLSQGGGGAPGRDVRRCERQRRPIRARAISPSHASTWAPCIATHCNKTCNRTAMDCKCVSWAANHDRSFPSPCRCYTTTSPLSSFQVVLRGGRYEGT